MVTWTHYDESPGAEMVTAEEPINELPTDYDVLPHWVVAVIEFDREYAPILTAIIVCAVVYGLFAWIWSR